MEISIGDYGRMMFQLMAGGSKPYLLPPHWESIKDKAMPLVEELIKLNKEMNNGGYHIYGYINEKSKNIISNAEAISLAQKKLWGCTVENLQKGDFIWLINNDEYEMYVGESDPCLVEYINENKEAIVNLGTYLIKLNPQELVLKLPKDFNDDYESDNYWLKKAKELAIID